MSLIDQVTQLAGALRSPLNLRADALTSVEVPAKVAGELVVQVLVNLEGRVGAEGGAGLGTEAGAGLGTEGRARVGAIARGVTGCGACNDLWHCRGGCHTTLVVLL